MQIKWSKRQRLAIEKTIKHYNWVLEDLGERHLQIVAYTFCPFCQMYRCESRKRSKCPNIVIDNGCMHQLLVKRINRNHLNYIEGKRGSEKWLRKAILARIEFWEGQL